MVIVISLVPSSQHGQRVLPLCYVHSYELVLRLICGAVFDRTLVPFRFPRLLLGGVPYVMVPKATKNDHDGNEREDDRLHNALLFCCLLNTLLAHARSQTCIDGAPCAHTPSIHAAHIAPYRRPHPLDLVAPPPVSPLGLPGLEGKPFSAFKCTY